MKKYIIIAAVSTFLFVGCSKVSTNPDGQSTATSSSEGSTGAGSAGVGSTGAGSGKTGGIEARPGPITPGADLDPVKSTCYTITNTEVAAGFEEYTFTYADAEGATHTVPLLAGQSVSFRSKTGFVKANFAYFLINGGGNCGPR